MVDKHLLILVLATAPVLGQRIPYNRGPVPNADNAPLPVEEQPIDRNAYLNYDYEDYGQPQPVPAAVPISRDDSGGGGSRQRLPPANSINSYYAQQDCKSRERTLPHDKYCDHYYQLNGCSGSDDQAILRACPNGLVYTGNGRQGLIGVCDYPHRAECSGRERHNPPISTDHCDWLYGIFGHETSCTRYWTCWNGTATEQFCIGGLLYNEETHACDWPQNVGGCQKHPLCKDDPNGNVPLGKSCNRYWACQGGYPRLQRCPAMLVFEKSRKRCIKPPTDDCDIPVTTPGPDEESDGSGNTGGRGGGGGNARPQQPQRNSRPDQQPPENRRRFQQDQQGGQFQSQGLPFDLPEGVTLLQRQ